MLVPICRALGDESRVRVLAALHGGELCVCYLIELLRLAPSTVSKHLAILKDAGLVQARKEGRWIYYRLPEAPSDDVRAALAFVFASLDRTKTVQRDAVALKRILKTDPVKLCRKQRDASACCSSAPATPAAARWRKAGRDN